MIQQNVQLKPYNTFGLEATARKESPLRKAEDAVEVDTSFMTLDEQVNVVCHLAEEIIKKL